MFVVNYIAGSTLVTKAIEAMIRDDCDEVGFLEILYSLDCYYFDFVNILTIPHMIASTVIFNEWVFLFL